MTTLPCFNPCFDGSVARGAYSDWLMYSSQCFNPCFDGSVARGVGAVNASVTILNCFNPCFDGSVARGSFRLF